MAGGLHRLAASMVLLMGAGRLSNRAGLGCHSVPVAVSTAGVLSGVTLTQISVGNVFFCALGSTGAAYCWGYDASGQLGNGSTTSSSVAVAVTAAGVLSGTTLTQVSAGASFTRALGGTGVPYCWGLDSSGQLGNSSTTTSSVPVAVTVTGALAGVRLAQVSAGNTDTCAVGSTGAYCWDANGSGQLGDGTATNTASNTTATWNPSVQIAVPGGAIAGTYAGTITSSVS